MEIAAQSVRPPRRTWPLLESVEDEAAAIRIGGTPPAALERLGGELRAMCGADKHRLLQAARRMDGKVGAVQRFEAVKPLEAAPLREAEHSVAPVRAPVGGRGWLPRLISVSQLRQLSRTDGPDRMVHPYPVPRTRNAPDPDCTLTLSLYAHRRPVCSFTRAASYDHQSAGLPRQPLKSKPGFVSERACSSSARSWRAPRPGPETRPPSGLRAEACCLRSCSGRFFD